MYLAADLPSVGENRKEKLKKSTVTRPIFRKKSGETAPQRGTRLSKRTQRSGSLTVSSTPLGCFFHAFRLPNCQKATALAAATLRESTPWDMGIITV